MCVNPITDILWNSLYNGYSFSVTHTILGYSEWFSRKREFHCSIFRTEEIL